MPKYLIVIKTEVSTTNHEAEGTNSMEALAKLTTKYAKNYEGCFIKKIRMELIDDNMEQHLGDLPDDWVPKIHFK